MTILDKINGTVDRAKVILTAAVTYITLATGVITVAVATAVPSLPDPWGSRVAAFGASAVTFLLGVAQVIRRVTPVPKEERGVLSK